MSSFQAHATTARSVMRPKAAHVNTPIERSRAALAVARMSLDIEDRALLLDILGLVPDGKKLAVTVVVPS